MDDTGRPEIVDNIEGKNIAPSVVEFTSAKSYIVGDEAKAQIGANDENIAQEVKGLLVMQIPNMSILAKLIRQHQLAL